MANKETAPLFMSLSCSHTHPHALFVQRARLQELGPRFTLKLRWLQAGTFDTTQGEYEWVHKRKEMDLTRRTFHM